MRRLPSAVFVAAATLIAVAACKEDRALVTSPYGPPSYDVRNFATDGLVPGGTVSLVAPDTIVFALTNIRDLASGSGYVFWAADNSATGYVRLTGDILEIFHRDSTVGGVVVTDPLTDEPIEVSDTTPILGVDSYAGPSDDAVYLVVARMAAGGAASLNSGVVSLEQSAASPTRDNMFLWRRIAAEGAGSMFYGNFGGPADEGTLVNDTIVSPADDDYVFQPVSSSLIAGFRGDEFVMDVARVGRPPMGFVYHTYLVDDAGVGTLVDFLRSQPPDRADLSDADMNDAEVIIGFDTRKDQVIPDGEMRNCVQGGAVTENATTTCTLALTPSADSSAFRGFLTIAVTLDPKVSASGLGRNIIFSGAVPDDAVRKGKGEYQ